MPTRSKSQVSVPRNPKLIRGNGGGRSYHPADKQSPSAFLAEMALTTQERLNQTYEMRLPQIIELLDMSEMTHQKNTVVDMEEPLFQPFPSEIVFQNFEAHNTYKIPLQLRNNDQVARLVKVVQAQSPYFKIVSPPDVGHKVAPGMDAIFYIHFTPDQKKDYDHELICITEREKFLVPIKGIGARGILDFPDEIHFGSCPVKYTTTKTLLIRNIGNREAKFNLLVERPFSVAPDKGVLAVGSSVQINVCFEPWKTGGCTSHLVIQYDTDEVIFVGLHGDSVDINVRLNKNTVRLENTYLGSASRRTVQLSNHSEVLVHYSWKAYATAIEEEQQRQMYYHQLELNGTTGSDTFLEECISDPLMRDKFSLISRTIKGKVKIAEDDKMLYEDKNIIIEPLEGDIWPGCNVNVNIIFKPDDARTYSQTAYCDLTGRATRLPLRVRGDGIGPKIEFSFDTLDVENVFISSEHSYEVVIANKGDIDAVFNYVPSSTLFGGQFAFSPSDGIVKVGDYQAIQILFSSKHLGQFSETFYWNVEGSKEQFKFNVRGCIIGPTFHFNVPYLKFGSVSYGFSYEQTFRLVNTSLIPMTFTLHIPTDGKGVVASDVTLSFLEGVIDMNDVYQQIKEKPIEFEILPSNGVLLPLSEIIIQICFTSLSSGKIDTALMVDVEGIGKDLMSLPISAKCVVPTINVGSPLLDYGRCFIRHPYQRLIELHNDTDFPAKYELIAQSEVDQHDVIYSSRLQRGIIEARSLFEVPLDITFKTIGKTDACVYFSIYGSRHETLRVQVVAIGEGPVIHFSETQIDFGTVPVLATVPHMVQLSNESLIPAQFHCGMVRPLSYFTVEPVSAIIPPETSMLLKVSVKVNDNVKFQDKLRVIVSDSQTHTIRLTATGSGTTIIVEPTFSPLFDLGPQFSNRTLQRKFRFYNKGRRPQQIYWLTEGFSYAKSRKTKLYNAEDMKYKNMPPPPEPPKPVFKLIPDRLSLAPGRYQDVILEGFSSIPRDVKERMICQAIIGNSTGKEKVMTVDILANFILPLLQFSEKKLSFTVIKQPDTDISEETKELSMKNASQLPLLTVFKVTYPFQLLYETSDGSFLGTNELELNIEKEATLLLQFDPNFVNDNYSRVADSMLEIVYKDHPSTDVLPLEGSVFYPNLEFEMMEVNFTSVLNDTEHVRTVNVTNQSPIDVYYTWSFIQHDICFEGKDEDEGLGKDLSDSSDEEKFPTNNSFSGDIESSYLQSALDDRPKTSPVSSMLCMNKRPSSAPPSVTQFTCGKERSSAVTWSQLKQPPLNVGIEEVFDILPLYGCLKASESQQFQFTFYGHTHIMAEATAVCSVRGGPNYKIQLTGQASLIRYTFSQKEIDIGKQLYDQVNSVDIELVNTGKVSFDFVALNMNIGNTLKPGVVKVNPEKGVVDAGQKVILSIKFIPGVPEPFDKAFQIRVAHFEPETLRIFGVGVFPRLTLNLPKEENSPNYDKLYEEAKRNLLEVTVSHTLSEQPELCDTDIQEELERLEVKYFALQEHERKVTTHCKKKSNTRPLLTSYVLDVGHVIIGTCITETCRLTNNGHFSLSFYVDHQSIAGTGFYVDLDRVKGFPADEFLDFDIAFNPSSVNLSLGPVEAVLPIKIMNGPVITILLRSIVTMPDISLSNDMIEFGEVICGQCNVKTIQVQNMTQVRCEWSTEAPEERKEIDKFVPMHLRKKIKNQVSKPKIFEIMPPSCLLAPGQKINVQVKFMPTEEATYQEKLYIKVSQSSSKHFISCKGSGKEPHIEFEKSLFTFGPILPHSGKDEVVVKVMNPCSMPIEFYSLEFDKQYLDEEQVLRTLKGYDEYNTILLPPRTPGELLPKQLLDSYEELNKTNEANEKISNTVYPGAFNNDLGTQIIDTGMPGLDATSKIHGKVSENDESSKEMSVGDLEITPVSAAIASYLGIDLSVEGRAARNRRGICIVVHGAPLSGKTATVRDLAKKYNSTILSIDDVILEALAKGRSAAANRARELCSAAARLAKAGAETQVKTEPEATTGHLASSKLSGQPRKPSMMPLKKSAQASAVSPQTVPSVTFISKKLPIIPDNPDEEFYNCVLPDDLLVELLAERLQVSDCHKGVVIDGLETVFTSSLLTAATILLRAINNRKYIYVVTLKFDFETLFEINADRVMEEERLKIVAEQTEWLYYEEMSEDEYDSLPDDERKLIDQKRLTAKRQRILKKKEFKEQMERELREKEEEERRLDDERNKKGRKSIQPSLKIKEKKSTEKIASVREINSNKLNAGYIDGIRPDTSVMSDISGSFEDSEKKGKGKVFRQKSAMVKDCPVSPIEELKDNYLSEEEKKLKSRFQTFEQTLHDIFVLFDTWDRAIGAVANTESEKGENENDIAVSTSANKKTDKTDKKKSDKDKLKEISESPALSQSSVDNNDSTPAEDSDKLKDGIGVPNIILQTKEPQTTLIDEVIAANILPNTDEVMDGIGVGPSGPPIPPEATFSVVSYPINREALSINRFGQHYTIVPAVNIATNPVQEEKNKPELVEVEKPIEKKDSRKHKSRLDRQPSANTRKGRHSSLAKSESPLPPNLSPDKDSASNDKTSKMSLDFIKYRWIINPGESIDLRVVFTSQELGQFDQTLNFEIVGTRRQYQVFCRGICSFPNISREPRIVFPHRKKVRKPDEIVHKKYILSSETFEFGPVLAGKNRERYREGRYPENKESICISNNSPMDAEISFAYLNDPNATTFLLEPPAMFLKPGQSQILTIWAYPKTPGDYEDTIVCCVKENPEPILFKVSATGVRPELELDRRLVQFDRVLLHRKETRTVYLRNSTLLPVTWKLNGMENLGDDFSLTVDHGVIEPLTEFSLQMHFRAIKPVNIKKIVRLEVSDADNVMGLAHAENIQVQAEAYDVALDISFPKGADGGLDFGTLRVNEEAKQTCTLKNKGRYEIQYQFIFEDNEKISQSTQELFTINPMKGSLLPNDRPTQVQVTFKSTNEISITDLPILKCQIIEPSMSEEGEIIANIPVKIGARSVYSKYSIYPVNDINFGPVLVNTKKTKTFVIENKSEFDFRFSIMKSQNITKQKLGNQMLRTNSRQNSLYSGKSQQIHPQRSRRDSIKGENLVPTVNPGPVHNNIRLTIGMFSILPANGVVLPGSSTTVTVEMLSEVAMVGVEDFIIDISERSPTDNPNGVEYRLLGEACLPSILSLQGGYSSIFEEHRIVKNLNVFRYHTQELPAGTGVFGEDESKFIFYNVIVGHKAEARFKITNSNKVPCDVLINVKPISNKQAHKIVDIFDVQPPRAFIPPHGSIFAMVNFQPPSMQAYSCIFDAVVDGLAASISRGRNLTFEIQGDGNLPRISIVKPVTSNNKGSPIIVFNKMLVGRSQMAPIVIKNGGTLPSDVEMTLTDPYQSFLVTESKSKDGSDNPQPYSGSGMLRLSTTSTKPVTASIHVGVGEVFHFVVEFTPKSRSKMVGDVRFSVRNNPFEDTTIQLIGEGYQEEVTIDNIQLPLDISSNSIVGEYQVDSDEIIVPSSNQLLFGDCSINVPKMLHFTVFNHSQTDTIRFYWDSYSGLSFKPSCGHLQPKCAKDVSVVFSSGEPCKLENLNVACKVNKIMVSKDLRRVANWDDTKKVIHWVDEVPSQQSPNQVGLDTQSTFPFKRKVIEIEEEPAHSVIPDSYLEVDLICSANCNYATYACKTDRIYFRDTYIFQTRVFTFTLKNAGEVSFDYEWNIVPGVYHPPSPVEEIFSEPVKSAKSSRKGAQSGLSKSQSPALRNSGMAKNKTVGKLRTSTTTSEISDVESAPSSQAGQMGYTNDGRPASVMTLVYETGNTSSALMQGKEMMPFTIEPECGSIAVGQEAVFTVRYSPLEVVEFDAILTANIANLDQTAEKPVIALHGRSLLPWCHFELPESCYITERRNPELRGPNGASAGSKLDSSTKTIEFEACGVNTKVVKKFFVLNPTDTSYTFQWVQESMDRTIYNIASNFECRTPKGTIQPGKKFEMKFEYIVEGLEVNESFWRFILPEQNVSVPFVFVGYGNEPAISFDRSHINFKRLLLGHTAKEIVQLLNEEDQSFAFNFNESSRHAPGHIASLIVEPMKGVVPAKSQMPITIKYKPEHESEVNFNLSCIIKKKNSPLTLNVKAEGFCVNMNLVCEDSTGSKVQLSPKGINVINFGDVELNEKAYRQVFIENNGLFNLDYHWTITGPNKPKDNKHAWNVSNPPVTVTPDNGNVASNSKRRCQIVFCPPCKLYLKNCKLLLKIVNGPTFQLSITGSGCPPALDFSFLSHDFGPCFIYRNGLPVQKRHLHVTNNDTKDISLECLFTSTDCLEVRFIPGVVNPGETKAIEIRFYPRELKQYNERVSFEVNGLSIVTVDIRGEGTDMRVEVLSSIDKKVNLGAVKVNEKTKRPVRIVNNSLAAIEFTVTCIVSETALQNPNVLFVTPNTLISLKPKATCDVMVQFHPRSRISQFVGKVCIECMGAAQQIFEITGSCQGMELKLDSDAIPFGSVTLGSSSSRKLIMMNTGDLGTKFDWNVASFLPSFNILPSSGYISPGMEVPFEITFSPHDVSQDIRCDDLRCTFENGRSLKLVLTGSCIAQMPMKEVVHFSTHVRNRDTKNITIHNKTNQVWILKPVIEGEYWSGLENFLLEPQQSKMYELIYRPLTMTQDQKKHTGSVFFALPDGSGLLYNLLGSADVPKPVSNIQRDVPCKMAYTELLNVCNWLRKPQRFRVLMEVLKPEKPEPSTTFKGLDYVDVPSLSKKEYKLHFFAHKEGTFNNKITFKNEQSGEFQFYYVTFKVASPNSLGCIELTSPARQSASHVVTLHNPLPTMVNFLTNCNVQDVNLPPQFTVAPQSEGSCTFEYLPLKAGVVNGRLNLQSLELGTYMYDLNLTATTAAQERAVHFATTLGTNQIQPCKFISYARTRAEYSCKVDSSEFSVEKSINAASAASGGVEVSIDVTFEPSRLGDCQGLLSVASPIGGEYTFPLYGHCMLPKPQGPYTIKAGSSTQIPFKNIFAQTTLFAFHIDNPSFTVKSGETIRAKKNHNIVVSFDGNQSESKAVRMGRLVVTCARSAGTGSNLTWTFYLKGVTP